uniref:Uncharacterized protein n=1 Tax=Herposiphonia versicolor TaxID=2007163 RepID=A0A1Z1MGI3_9FLOR|nr:hypothetical protein [Herposiphonia versicolor]ARW64871.1 hypothetical protein [Herposiphonia versicolor]
MLFMVYVLNIAVFFVYYMNNNSIFLFLRRFLQLYVSNFFCIYSLMFCIVHSTELTFI